MKCSGFLVGEGCVFLGKVFSIFTCFAHVVDEAIAEGFVFAGFVLFVEDAVLFVFEAKAAEEVM